MTGTQSLGSLRGSSLGGAPKVTELTILALGSEFKGAGAMTANYYRHLTLYATGDYSFAENRDPVRPTPS